MTAPRDSQRSRVYTAESGLPDDRLGTLTACEAEMTRVVASDWWANRFPERRVDALPGLRPGNGARRAFYRDDNGAATITLPRRYRTRGVVLHELVHWALADAVDLADHGPAFTRVLVDATAEHAGPARAGALIRAFARQRVRVGREGRTDGDGRVRYGWDERLDRSRGRPVTILHHHGRGVGLVATAGRFTGYGRGRLTVRLRDEDTLVTVPVAGIVDVRVPGAERAARSGPQALLESRSSASCTLASRAATRSTTFSGASTVGS